VNTTPGTVSFHPALLARIRENLADVAHMLETAAYTADEFAAQVAALTGALQIIRSTDDIRVAHAVCDEVLP